MDMQSFTGGDLINAKSQCLPCTATIASVVVQELGDGQPKPILIFNGMKERLALNKTNVGKLIEHFGIDSDDWIGGEVHLSVGKTMYMGKKVSCVDMETSGSKPVGKMPF
jgi:hypothetical protein